jgi:hypothetical protein
MQTFKNHQDAHLMIWEPSMKLRNEDDQARKKRDPQDNYDRRIIKFNLLDNLKCNVGDRVLGATIINGQASTYVIEEIIENRPSSISGFNYITARTTWGLT